MTTPAWMIAQEVEEEDFTTPGVRVRSSPGCAPGGSLPSWQVEAASVSSRFLPTPEADPRKAHPSSNRFRHLLPRTLFETPTSKKDQCDDLDAMSSKKGPMKCRESSSRGRTTLPEEKLPSSGQAAVAPGEPPGVQSAVPSPAEFLTEQTSQGKSRGSAGT